MAEAWAGCPLADNSSRRGYDPTPFQGAELFVNGVAISLDLAVAYSIPDGWVIQAVLDEDGRVHVTDDGRGIAYLRLEGRVEWRPRLKERP